MFNDYNAQRNKRKGIYKNISNKKFAEKAAAGRRTVA